MIRRLLVALVCCLCLAGQAQAKEQLKLLAGTTMLEDILTDLCPQAEVRAMIPGGACPGHYDLRPADLALLAEADALFLHPWQRGLENVQALVEASANAGLRVLVVPESGNAMVPEVQGRYVRAMATMLGEMAPHLRNSVQEAAAVRLARVDALDSRLTAKLRDSGAGRCPVACAIMLEPLLRWAGLPVAVGFSRPGDMTPEQMAGVIDRGRDRGTALVVDNLQSGDKGRGLAEEFRVGRVVLSNFPGGFPDTSTWEKALEANVRILIEALEAVESGS